MNAVWSGGIAFSYFPATSTGGSFGIVTVSGNTVTTGPDFDSLAAGYTAVTFINSPARGSSSVTYPTCAAPSTAFVASNTLPPTPNDGACACVQRTTSCQFTPKVADYSAVVGQLIGAGCTLLSQTGGNCLDIGGDGQTGVYGRLAGCDPGKLLSSLPLIPQSLMTLFSYQGLLHHEPILRSQQPPCFCVRLFWQWNRQHCCICNIFCASRCFFLHCQPRSYVCFRQPSCQRWHRWDDSYR